MKRDLQDNNISNKNDKNEEITPAPSTMITPVQLSMTNDTLANKKGKRPSQNIRRKRAKLKILEKSRPQDNDYPSCFIKGGAP